MKKLFIVCLLGLAVFLYAENTEQEKDHVNGFGISYKLGEFSKDYSLGIGITSPRFCWNTLAIRLNLDVPFRHSNWKPYLTTGLTILGGNFMKTADIRLYGGGGLILVFPLQKNEAKILIGGQGFFGFEFFINAQKNGFSYFIEIGGSGANAIKNKTNYRYTTGFMAHTGFRYYIPIKNKERKNENE